MIKSLRTPDFVRVLFRSTPENKKWEAVDINNDGWGTANNIWNSIRGAMNVDRIISS